MAQEKKWVVVNGVIPSNYAVAVGTIWDERLKSLAMVGPVQETEDKPGKQPLATRSWKPAHLPLGQIWAERVISITRPSSAIVLEAPPALIGELVAAPGSLAG